MFDLILNTKDQTIPSERRTNDLHICTFAHLHICTSTYLHIRTSAHLHICTFTHLQSTEIIIASFKPVILWTLVAEEDGADAF